MTEGVIHFNFAPLQVVELPGWTIRLLSADEDGTLSGTLVGRDVFNWVFHPGSDAVSVSGDAPGFQYGIPDESLRKPLWEMIRSHS